MKTYIGKRLNTKNKLSHFYLFENGDVKGGDVNPNVPIGSILNDDGSPTGEMCLDEDIAVYTRRELDSENAKRIMVAKEKLRKSTPNELKQFIAYMNRLKLNRAVKMQMLESIRESILS